MSVPSTSSVQGSSLSGRKRIWGAGPRKQTHQRARSGADQHRSAHGQEDRRHVPLGTDHLADRERPRNRSKPAYPRGPADTRRADRDGIVDGGQCDQARTRAAKQQAVLALVQFTIIIDFMIMSPLGAIMMPPHNISSGWRSRPTHSAREFPASWRLALPISSIASGCFCFFMSALPLERRFARSLPTIMCCCWGGSLPALSGGGGSLLVS